MLKCVQGACVCVFKLCLIVSGRFCLGRVVVSAWVVFWFVQGVFV